MSGCPHKEARFCPLYVASNGLGGGCDGGRLTPAGGCEVERGTMNYSQKLELLRARFPREVAALEFEEAKEIATEQRKRNMRLAGVH